MRLSEHFDSSEFACKDGCGFDKVDPKLIEELEKIRAHYNAPIHINSGCRCPARNKQEGGAPSSQHLLGKAADIVVEGVSADDVATYLEATYPNCCGVGRYVGRTHFDVRPNKARWDFRNDK